MTFTAMHLCLALNMATPVPFFHTAYDFEAGKQKLQRIGVALQIYRQNKGFKPVAQRFSQFDAGMPQSMFQLTKPGKPWSVPIADVQVQASQDPLIYKNTWHFVDSFLMGSILNPRQKREIWSQRGEDVPVLFDMNGYTPQQWFGPGTKRILILRLGGTVSDIEVSGYDVENWVLTR